MSYIEKIDKNRIPQHIAIIMDGNGRWAKQRGKERTYGHQAGAETVHKIIEDAARLGVKYLTLYTFSTENWNRPQEGSSSFDESIAGFYRRRNSDEEQYPFPHYWRYKEITC